MHSITDPSKVRFSGPLEPFACGLTEEFAGLGYTPTSAAIQLQFAAHLSRWLAGAGLGPADLSGAVVDRFLIERRAGYTNHYSGRALAAILGYLRRVGAAPAGVAPRQPLTVAEALVERFACYLLTERALTEPVARAYCRWVRPFVQGVVCGENVDRCADLAAGDVTRFLAERLPGMSRKSAQMTACSLRSFLRFVHAAAMVAVDLSDAVPSVAYWRLAGLPQALDADQIRALLGACDTSTPLGRRDLAVITVMRRMGLRCAEVAALGLRDIDWTAGTLTVHGKGNRTDRLPLPVDVGQAVVDYLRRGRPVTAARTVFVRCRAPFTALAPGSVTYIVARAADRAGLGTVYGHRLRHTAATSTLNAGASLEEVAQLMRHAGVATTFGYAKTDQNRLAQLARPWPSTGDTR
jgi:integrase/recombinase XerD